MLKQINEAQVKKDHFLVQIREAIRERGYSTLYNIKDEICVRNKNIKDMAKSLNYDYDQLVKDIECDDLIRVQYGDGSYNLWYYDPHRERHLIEDISGIGPE